MPAYDVLLQLKAAGSQTTSTSGTAVDLGNAVPNGGQLLQFDLLWNVLGGTPTVDVYIEESADNTTFRQVTQFRQLVTADNSFVPPNENGKKMLRFGLVTQRWLRYRSVIGGGTPSINFSLWARGLDAVAMGSKQATF